MQGIFLANFHAHLVAVEGINLLWVDLDALGLNANSWVLLHEFHSIISLKEYWSWSDECPGLDSFLNDVLSNFENQFLT